MQTYSVYIHTHVATNRKYVGVTAKTLSRRKGAGWYGYRGSPALCSVLKAEGWKAFKSEVVGCGLCHTAASTLERQLIAIWQTRDASKGFNRQPGGLPSRLPAQEAQRVSKIITTLKEHCSSPAVRSQMSSRMHKVWHTPLSREHMLKVRQNSQSGRPAVSVQNTQTGEIYADLTKASAALAVHKSTLSRLLKESAGDVVTIPASTRGNKRKHIITIRKVVDVKESELPGHPNGITTMGNQAADTGNA